MVKFLSARPPPNRSTLCTSNSTPLAASSGATRRSLWIALSRGPPAWPPARIAPRQTSARRLSRHGECHAAAAAICRRAVSHGSRRPLSAYCTQVKSGAGTSVASAGAHIEKTGSAHLRITVARPPACMGRRFG